MRIVRGSVLNGRYTLSEHIATGGMGEVWRAHDDVLARDVAVKLLKAEFSEHEGFLRRFRDEARHAASLSHPGIAAVHDYGEQDGSPFLVMELVSGEPLSRLLARIGPLPLDRALGFLADTADALGAAHARGVVHRDVKPGNLLVTDEGRVKVTDFGIARAIGAAPVTATGEVVGTAQYISPEQAMGETATPASDLYALGVVAYEVLTGQRPFTSDNPVALASAHVHQMPPPLPQTMPDDVRAIVGQALAKSPAQRPLDAPTMAAQLRAAEARRAAAVSDDGATAMMPVTATAPMPTAPRPAGRRAARRALVASVGLTVAAGLVALSVRAGGDEPSAGSVTSNDEATSTLVTAPTTTVPATTPPPAATVAPPATTTVATPDVIDVDPAEYIGRKRGDVRSELETLGLVVDERTVDADGAKKDTVVDLSPQGDVRPGDTVTLLVAAPGRRGDSGGPGPD